MPNINVVYWNIENFGAINPSTFQVDQKTINDQPSSFIRPYPTGIRIKFIAEAVKNMQADILCLIELVGEEKDGNSSDYKNALESLRQELNAITEGANWHYDFVKGALGMYDSGKQAYHTIETLEWSRDHKEGYAVFWKQNIAKFRMQVSPPIAVYKDRDIQATNDKLLVNEQSFGVHATYVDQAGHEQRISAIEVFFDAAKPLVISAGTVFPNNFKLLGGQNVQHNDTLTEDVDIRNIKELPAGTQIGPKGIRYTYEAGKTVILVPGGYTLIEKFILPKNNEVLIPKHCLSLVMEGRDIDMSQYNSTTVTYSYPKPSTSSKYPAGYYPKLRQKGASSDEVARFRTEQAAEQLSEEWDANSNYTRAYYKERVRVDNGSYKDFIRVKWCPTSAENFQNNPKWNLLPFPSSHRLDKSKSYHQDGLGYKETEVAYGRRPAFCTILCSSENITTQNYSKYLMPIIMMHTPATQWNDHIGVERTSMAAKLASWSRPLYQVFVKDITQKDPLAGAWKVSQLGVIGGDFNLHLIDTRNANFNQNTSPKPLEIAARKSFTNPYANAGANLKMLIQDNGTAQYQNFTSLAQMTAELNMANIHNTTDIRWKAFDQVFYKASPNQLNILNPFKYGHTDCGHIYDLVLALVSFEQLDQVLFTGNNDDELKNNFPQFTSGLLKSFNTVINEEQLFERIRTCFKANENNGYLSDEGSLKSYAAAGMIIRYLLSDHLPIVFPFAIETAIATHTRCDLRDAQLTVSTKAGKNTAESDEACQVYLSFLRNNTPLAFPYLTVVFAITVGEFLGHRVYNAINGIKQYKKKGDDEKYLFAYGRYNAIQKRYEASIKAPAIATRISVEAMINGRALTRYQNSGHQKVTTEIDVVPKANLAKTQFNFGNANTTVLTENDTGSFKLVFFSNSGNDIGLVDQGTITLTTNDVGWFKKKENDPNDKSQTAVDIHFKDNYAAIFCAPDDITGITAATITAQFKKDESKPNANDGTKIATNITFIANLIDASTSQVTVLHNGTELQADSFVDIGDKLIIVVTTRNSLNQSSSELGSQTLSLQVNLEEIKTNFTPKNKKNRNGQVEYSYECEYTVTKLGSLAIEVMLDQKNIHFVINSNESLALKVAGTPTKLINRLYYFDTKNQKHIELAENSILSVDQPIVIESTLKDQDENAVIYTNNNMPTIDLFNLAARLNGVDQPANQNGWTNPDEANFFTNTFTADRSGDLELTILVEKVILNRFTINLKVTALPDANASEITFFDRNTQLTQTNVTWSTSKPLTIQGTLKQSKVGNSAPLVKYLDDAHQIRIYEENTTGEKKEMSPKKPLAFTNGKFNATVTPTLEGDTTITVLAGAIQLSPILLQV
ncbi:MAG: hypothetical protein ACPGJS_22380, partial [Flammeovirgaceae bacterium]